jgi:hypothetical protein
MPDDLRPEDLTEIFRGRVGEEGVELTLDLSFDEFEVLGASASALTLPGESPTSCIVRVVHEAAERKWSEDAPPDGGQ